MTPTRVIITGALGVTLLLRGVIWRQLPSRRTARHHPMQYYLALPRGWSPDRSWPVLVVVDGANHGHFLFSCLRFMLARKDLPFIIVSPLVLTNTGNPRPSDYSYGPAVWAAVATAGAPQFDTEGALAVVDDIEQLYHGCHRFFITGWSAGGHLTWRMIFTHPERLSGAVLAGANYRGRGITEVSGAPERVTLPIRALQGDHDPLLAALNEQWTAARQLAEQHGYQTISREVVAGGGHSPFPERVFAVLAPLLQD